MNPDCKAGHNKERIEHFPYPIQKCPIKFKPTIQAEEHSKLTILKRGVYRPSPKKMLSAAPSDNLRLLLPETEAEAEAETAVGNVEKKREKEIAIVPHPPQGPASSSLRGHAKYVPATATHNAMSTIQTHVQTQSRCYPSKRGHTRARRSERSGRTANGS